jgi:hypothetical protein
MRHDEGVYLGCISSDTAENTVKKKRDIIQIT